MNPQLDAYIKQAKASGQTDEQIKQALLASGWKQEQINEAFGIPNPQGSVVPPLATGAGNNKLMAVLSYISFLWVIPLMTESKNDPFVKFHVKQGIILSICGIVIWLFAAKIPFVGWFLSPLLNLGVFVLAIMGIMNATNNKQEVLPVVGQFADNLKF